MKRLIFIACLVFFVTACSSGGDGGGGNTSQYSLSLSPSALNFQASRNGNLPSAQTVSASFNGAGLAIVDDSVTPLPASWLTLPTSTSIGSSPYAVPISVNTTNLTVGTYSTVVLFATGNVQKTDGVIKRLTVTYTVTDSATNPPGTNPPDSNPTPLTLNTNQLNFSTLLGSTTATDAKPISVIGSANAWTANTDVSWLILDIDSGIAPATVNVTVDPNGLSAGKHVGSIQFTDTGSNTTRVVNVTFTVVQPEIVANTSIINFSAVNGSVITPADVALSINTVPTFTWTATASDDWINLNGTAGPVGGSATDTLSIGIDAARANIGKGSYTGSVAINTSVNGLVYKTNIDVNLTLSAASVTISTQSLAFLGINGTDLGTNSFVIRLNTGAVNHPWNATIDSADGAGGQWLRADNIKGDISNLTAATVVLSVDAAKLSSGTYTGGITIVTQVNGDLVSATLPVTLNLTPAKLSLSVADISFSGIKSASLGSETFSISLDTGSVAYPWSASLNAGDGNGGTWLLANNLRGSVSTTTTDQQVLSIDASNLPSGLYSGNVKIDVQINGDLISQVQPVSLRLEPHRLFITDNGVAFSSFPTQTAILNRSIVISDNTGVATNWAATSDQTWLTVTASGTTGVDSINLTADPVSLANDTIHYANVTVTSSDATIENSESISVGFWVASVDPTNNVVVATSYNEIIADPIRPYVYVHNNGSDIDIYNVHTATLVSTMSNVASQLGEMTVSHNGAILYVADNTNFTVVPVNLATQLAATAWPVDKSTALRLTHSRPNGFSVIIMDNGNIYNAVTGDVFSSTFVVKGSNLSTSLNGEKFCSINSGVSQYTLSCYDMSYSFLNGGEVQLNSLAPGKNIRVNGNGHDVTLSADGSRVYTAAGAPYVFEVYDGNSMDQLLMTLPAAAYPNNIELGPNGLLYGASNKARGPTNVWIYDATGIEQSTFFVPNSSINNILPRQLIVSGDASRMVLLTSEPNMQFISTQTTPPR